MTENLQQEELMDLGNRLMHLRYSMDSDHLGLVFSEITLPDYMILMKFARKMGVYKLETKIYLKEICAELNLPMTRVSKMVQNLQGKGYVYWQHDEDGSQGTYIYLSETGAEQMRRQQRILEDYFSHIVNRIGADKVSQVLDLMERLENVMEEEAEKLHGPAEEEAEDFPTADAVNA